MSLYYFFFYIFTFSSVATYSRFDSRSTDSSYYWWLLNPIRSGLFQTVNDPGGGAPPLRSRKLLCQSSPYHTCEFYQVFLA